MGMGRWGRVGVMDEMILGLRGRGRGRWWGLGDGGWGAWWRFLKVVEERRKGGGKEKGRWM